MMFITAAPVAAPKPHAISLTSSATECQTSKPQTEAERIGELLAKLVFDGNVRSMEALAQVIVASDWGQISAVAALPVASPGSAASPAAAAVRAGERIARRALSGVLEDHSHGANRFHRAGDLPDWARENRPVAHVGEFLFYKV